LHLVLNTKQKSKIKNKNREREQKKREEIAFLSLLRRSQIGKF